MKKVVAIIVIIVALLVAPFFAGKMIQNKFENNVARLNAKLEKTFHQKDFIKLEYQAGWFSSSAKTIIGKIVIDHHITHGPYCTFGLAKIDSSFETSPKVQENLTHFFEDKKPYSIITQIGFSGTTKLTVNSPAFGEKNVPENPNVRITWQGLNFSTTISKDLISSSFELPKLIVSENGKGYLSIENVTSKGSIGKLLDNQLNFILPKHLLINGKSSIDKISFKVLDRTPVNLEINNIFSEVNTNTNDYTSSFGINNIVFTNKGSSLSMGPIKAEGISNDPLWIFRENLNEANWSSLVKSSLTGVNYTDTQQNILVALNYLQEQQLTDNKSSINYGELYKATDVNLQIPHFDNFIQNTSLNYKINNVPKEAASILIKSYVEYLKFILNLGLNAANQNYSANTYTAMSVYQDKLMLASQSFAIITLQNTPDVNLDFNLQGTKGDSNLSFTASLNKPDSSTDLQQLLINAPTRLNAKLVFNTSKTLVDAIAHNIGISDEQLADMKNNILNRYPIIENNNQYLLDIEFKDNSFYVNGKLDPDFLQKYSQNLN